MKCQPLIYKIGNYGLVRLSLQLVLLLMWWTE